MNKIVNMIFIVCCISYMIFGRPTNSSLSNKATAIDGDDARLYDAEVEYLQKPEDGNNVYISIPGLYPVAGLSTRIVVSAEYSKFWQTQIAFGFVNDWTKDPYRTYCLGVRSQYRLTTLYGVVSDGRVNYQSTTDSLNVSGIPDNTPIVLAFNAKINAFLFNETLIENSRSLTYLTDERGNWPLRLFQIVCNTGKQVLSGNYNMTHWASYRIYRATFWIDDIMVYDFQPVRVGDVGYMYDCVSGRLFGNEGTLDFIVGPDKVEE